MMGRVPGRKGTLEDKMDKVPSLIFIFQSIFKELKKIDQSLNKQISESDKFYTYT